MRTTTAAHAPMGRMWRSPRRAPRCGSSAVGPAASPGGARPRAPWLPAVRGWRESVGPDPPRSPF
eukprot:scaffold5048_cov102-Isochrysis_galbana.AAC.7